MRSRLLLPILAGVLVFGATRPAHAQTAQTPQAVAHFTGTGPQVTGPFTVADAWVVRWSAFRQMNVSVLGPDGSLVAGAAASRAALYVAKGGTYHLQIDYAATPPGAPANPNPVPGRPGMIDVSGRPYQVQIVQQSTALTTPSATSWVMLNFNLPGQGIAAYSGLNGVFAPPSQAPYYRPMPSSPSSQAPASGNNFTPANPAVNNPPADRGSSTPPPDAGG